MTIFQLKAAVVDDNLQIIQEARVIFDTDLPEFRTQGGAVINKADPKTVYVPTIMWVKALDMLMDRLTVAGVYFSKIAAVSGSAQVRSYQSLCDFFELLHNFKFLEILSFIPKIFIVAISWWRQDIFSSIFMVRIH